MMFRNFSIAVVALWLGYGTPVSAGSQLFAWGDLGQNKIPSGLSDTVAIAAGHFHNLALRADGSAVAWAGTPYDPAVQMPGGLVNVTRIAAGLAFSLALKTDGTVVAWGDNTAGRTNVPAALANVVAIAAGGHALALRADGSITAWGDNTFGQTTVPPLPTNVVALAAGLYHSLALTADGRVFAWGDNTFGQAAVPAGLTNVMAVAAGGGHSLALTAAGRVVGWGDNTYGQGGAPANLTNVVAIAAGDYHSLALKADGTVVAWGLRDIGATAVPVGLTNVVAIAAGGSHSLALVQDTGQFLTMPVVYRTNAAGSTVNLSLGSPVPSSWTCQWRFNGTALSGATNDTLTLTNLQLNQTGVYWVAASNALGLAASSETRLSVTPSLIISQPHAQTNAAGSMVTLSVVAQSTVPLTYQWRLYGTNLAGATNSTLVIPSVASDQAGPYSVVLSNAYGVVTSPDANLSVIVVARWSTGANSVRYLMNLGNVVSLAQSKGGWGLAARASGTVTGLLGGNLLSPYPSPPTDLTNVVAVAVGWQHALARKSDGSVAVWGSDRYGLSTIPADLTNVVAIGSGDFHNLALRSDGTVTAWGYNGAGSTLVPLALTNVVAIAAGYDQSLALTSNGKVIAWGSVPSVPLGLTNVVAMAGSFKHSLAIGSDSRVAAWGDTYGGATNVPRNLTNVLALAAAPGQSLALKMDGTVVAWGTVTNVPTSLSNFVAIAAGEGYDLALLGSGPPFFAEAPISRAVAIGETTSFRVAATGARPLSYQWQQDGADLPGATDAVLTLSNVGEGRAGNYSVRISNVFGTISSPPARLSVAPVLINALTVQPYSQVIYGGGTASFSVSAQGMDLKYQWQTNGVDLEGATNSTLILTNVQLSQVAAYSVRVSNALGSATSAGVNLDVRPSLVSVQPQSVTTFLGGPASFSAAAQGIGPFSYQWQFGGTDLSALASLSLSNVGWSQAGTYFVAVSNAFGLARSEANLFVVRVAAWGQSTIGQGPLRVPAGLTDVAEIAAGNSFSLALAADGSVVAWGQMSVPAGLTNIAAISAGDAHCLALRTTGTVVAWGDNSAGQTNVPTGLTNVVAIVAGVRHSLALCNDGTVVAWGDNGSGQANVPATLSKVVAIAAGYYHSLALRYDGTVLAWGNGSGQTNLLAVLTNIVAIAAGYYHSLALRTDGTVVGWGQNDAAQTNAPATVTNAVSIAAGGWHSLALTAEGTVIPWGSSDFRRSDVPLGLTNVIGIADGPYHSLALVGDGPPVLQVPITSFGGGPNGFTLSLPTQSGRVYALEYKNTLTDGHWTALPLIAGNGGVRTLTDPTAMGQQRFYRVRRW